MTKVDFYVLHQAGNGEEFVCRLIDKAFQQGNQVLVNTATPEQTKSLDALLWQVPATGFVPHSTDPAEQAQVSIDHTQTPGEHDDCLINLANHVPDYCSRFSRICEVVLPNDAAKAASREHYKYYRERGFPVTTHEIGK